MIAAIITFSIVWLVTVAIAVTACRFFASQQSSTLADARGTLQENNQHHQADRSRLISEMSQQRDDLMARSHEQETQIRADHTAEITRIRETYEKLIQANIEHSAAMFDKLMNAVNYGNINRVPAVVEDREPGPEQRAAREVDEATIKRAVVSLKAQYEGIGVNLPDAELEQEARNLVMGQPWQAPPSLAGLLKD